MAIDTKLISQLREMTGAGIGMIKEALEESDNDLEKAVEILRKKGAAKAAKKAAEREAGEGLVGSYIHANGQIGVLVEVHSETDFVARNEEFKTLVKDIAMQIAAANPLYISRDNVPADVIAKEEEIYKDQLKQEGKPEDVIDKIMEGKIEKYYQEACLLEQGFIKEDKMTVGEFINQVSGKLGEKIEVTRFTRFQINQQATTCDA